MFDCGICLFRYNSKSKLPLSLPCGHVFCKSCVVSCSSSGMTCCPFDKQTHSVSPRHLPTCYAILTNLTSSSNFVPCSRHPRKKVKFVCYSHESYLCSDCVLEHAGPGHLIDSFTPDLSKMRAQLEQLGESAQLTLSKISEEGSKHKSKERSLKNFYEREVVKVTSRFESCARMLEAKKKELVETLKKQLNEQQLLLQVEQMKVQKKLEAAQKWSNQVQEFLGKLKETSYEAFSQFVNNKQFELKKIQEFYPSKELKFYTYSDTLKIADFGYISLSRTKRCSGCQEPSEVCQCGVKKDSKKNFKNPELSVSQKVLPKVATPGKGTSRKKRGFSARVRLNTSKCNKSF